MAVENSRRHALYGDISDFTLYVDILKELKTLSCFFSNFKNPI